MPLNISRCCRVFLTASNLPREHLDTVNQAFLTRDPRLPASDALEEHAIDETPLITYDKSGLLTFNARVYAEPGWPMQVHFCIWEAPRIYTTEAIPDLHKFLDVRIELSINDSIIDVEYISADDITASDLPILAFFLGRRESVNTEKVLFFTSRDNASVTLPSHTATPGRLYTRLNAAKLDVLISVGRITPHTSRYHRKYRCAVLPEHYPYESSTLPGFTKYEWQKKHPRHRSPAVINEKGDPIATEYSLMKAARNPWPAQLQKAAYDRRIRELGLQNSLENDNSDLLAEDSQDMEMYSSSDEEFIVSDKDDNDSGSDSGEGRRVAHLRIVQKERAEDGSPTSSRILIEGPITLNQASGRTTPTSTSEDHMLFTPSKSSIDEEEPSTPLSDGLVDRNKKPYKLDYLELFSGMDKEDFARLQTPSHQTVTSLRHDDAHERSNSALSFSTNLYKSARQFEVNFECYMDLCRMHYEIGM